VVGAVHFLLLCRSPFAKKRLRRKRKKQQKRRKKGGRRRERDTRIPCVAMSYLPKVFLSTRITEEKKKKRETAQEEEKGGRKVGG